MIKLKYLKIFRKRNCLNNFYAIVMALTLKERQEIEIKKLNHLIARNKLGTKKMGNVFINNNYYW